MSDAPDENQAGPSCSFSFKKPLRRGQQNTRKREEVSKKDSDSDNCKSITL
jgi:hypothetical protein